MALRELRDYLFGPADRESAARNYRRLAAGYEATAGHILRVRRDAVAALALRPGETVFDVGCGAGATLPLLAQACGPGGQVVGIEQSAEMAAQARARLSQCAAPAVVLQTSVEELRTELRADAMLFCYTQDILQSPSAVARLAALARPGCRVAIAGVRFLPWSWGFALNAFTAIRARGYMTTCRGLRQPYRPLAQHCESLRVLRYYHWGTSYLAAGRFPG